jgi:hypothetical protein
VPASAKPEAPAAARPAGEPDIDWSLLGLITHWRLVVAEMSRVHHVDLYDPVVLARPWPGVRTLIFSLIDSPTQLRAALTRR